jgi:hypothetical protein
MIHAAPCPRFLCLCGPSNAHARPTRYFYQSQHAIYTVYCTWRTSHHLLRPHNHELVLTIVPHFPNVLSCSRDLLQAYLEQFPPYGCVRDPQQSRFRVDSTYVVSGNRVCLTARVVPCARPGSKCCASDVDFAKLELQIREWGQARQRRVWGRGGGGGRGGTGVRGGAGWGRAFKKAHGCPTAACRSSGMNDQMHACLCTCWSCCP